MKPANGGGFKDPELRKACMVLSDIATECLKAAGWRRSTSSRGVWAVVYGSPQRVPRDTRYYYQVGDWDDHGELFRRQSDGEYMYLSEPYCMGAETVKELTAFCDRHGLDFTIRAPSEWNPSGCVQIQIVRHGVPVHGGGHGRE